VAGTVLIVDEASQVATRDAERLLTAAAATGTVVILVGDPAQLGSVGAGGWFTHLTATTADLPALASNQRQRAAALAGVRQALTDLRSPDPTGSSGSPSPPACRPSDYTTSGTAPPPTPCPPGSTSGSYRRRSGTPPAPSPATPTPASCPR
jgi:hypothetical protein